MRKDRIMPKPKEKSLKDVQASVDDRRISIDKVGVKGVLYPIKVWKKSTKPGPKLKVDTVATVNMYVNVPHYQRGTHMSRLIEVLNKYKGLINIVNMKGILAELRQKLKAESAHMEVRFPYFINKSAPRSGSRGEVSYECTFNGSLDVKEGYDFILEVKVPIMTVCPCSKEISDAGAHNQRGIITVRVRWDKEVIWIEDLIEVMESSGSAPLYSVLKRPDEKYITEHSYKNPKFVEDVVRDAANILWADDNITWFRIEVENFESIHNHSAFAFIERNKEIFSQKELD